jgi:hypothetical protein
MKRTHESSVDFAKRRRLCQASGDAAIRAILATVERKKEEKEVPPKKTSETRRTKRANSVITGPGRTEHGLLILPERHKAAPELVEEVLREMPPLLFFNFVLTAKAIWAGEELSNGKDLPVRGISWNMGGCNSRGKHGHHVQANYVEALYKPAAPKAQTPWVGECPRELTERLFPSYKDPAAVAEKKQVIPKTALPPNPQVTVSIFLRYIFNTVGAPTKDHALLALRAARLQVQRALNKKGALFIAAIKLDNIQAVVYLFPPGDTTSYIDVDRLSKCEPGTVYFPDVIGRVLMPWIHVGDGQMVRFMVFWSGKCVVLGGKTYETYQKAREIMSRFLCHFVVRAPLGCKTRDEDAETPCSMDL